MNKVNDEQTFNVVKKNYAYLNQRASTTETTLHEDNDDVFVVAWCLT